jgi:hypothetical protein
MLEDTNFFSRLGEDLHIDPLLKDYLSFRCQLYVDHPADRGEFTPDNLPSCQKNKKSKQEDIHSETVNLANLVLDTTSIMEPAFEHHLPIETKPSMH